ncbi:hypothetical protein NM688_g5597 [Phlebia brevispora]|uniref:Uncharacterized protein n=1 Tax=Phlebia brevispora TaxID=194682 RepID=A0ACC1ST19_9APHY|nr:hypothetical protein NM688_g5597 [Phlebia brevispora]
MSPDHRARWGPVRSLLCLAPLLIGAPFYAYKSHYALPEPLVDLFDPATALPQISEAQILGYAKHLSEDIGYRTVGTREHALGDAWMLEKAYELQAQCEEAVKASPKRKLQCEVWRQAGNGSHRFDIMAKRLYKNYVNLSNIVIRVSDGTDEGKEHAVLVNSHLDSTLPSPGAADDALSVGVMLECARVLVNTPDWQPSNAIIFLFNNAEESLQDGSHLFSTQHPIAKTVRAAINLEAAGTTGPELLFQASSEQMIRAYARVPRPFGTILANEIFSSGIMLSDTDFRQFELYLNVTGLDMAVVGNSYLYHMRKDLVENIEPGVAQHMAENTLALLQYLSSPESPLPSLTAGFSKPATVFYQIFSFFVVYSFKTAMTLYVTLLSASLVFVGLTYAPPSPALKQSRGIVGDHVRGVLAIAAAFVGAVIGVNVVAFIMHGVLGKPLSWFATELSCLALYGPPALLGALATQFVVPSVRERTVFTSFVLLQSALACGGQFLGVGSSAVFFVAGLPIFIALVLDLVLTGGQQEVTLWGYAIGQLVPLTIGAQLAYAMLDVFVPLTGRMGEQAPAENIIATLVAVIGAYAFPLSIPFVHRYSRAMIARALLFLSVISALSIAIFSTRDVFDAMHQKRLFITSGEQHLHVGAADSAPGFGELAYDIAQRFGAPNSGPVPVVMNDWNPDWDTIYPFSAFVTPYKLDLPLREEYMDPLDYNFSVAAINNSVDEAKGVRNFTMVIRHPGIVWTSVAFDAHVLSWTLDNNPPDEFARHHIKEGSFYGNDAWSMDLSIKIPQPSSWSTEDGHIRVDFVGIHEKAMWPGKRAEKDQGGRAMVLFEEFDEWLVKEKGDTIDGTLLGCVGGVAWV